MSDQTDQSLSELKKAKEEAKAGAAAKKQTDEKWSLTQEPEWLADARKDYKARAEARPQMNYTWVKSMAMAKAGSKNPQKAKEDIEAEIQARLRQQRVDYQNKRAAEAKREREQEAKMTPKEKLERDESVAAFARMRARMVPKYRHVIVWEEKAGAFTLEKVTPQLQALAEDTWTDRFRSRPRHLEDFERPVYMFMFFLDDEKDPYDRRHQDLADTLNDRYAYCRYSCPSETPLQAYKGMVRWNTPTVPLRKGLGHYTADLRGYGGHREYERWQSGVKAVHATEIGDGKPLDPDRVPLTDEERAESRAWEEEMGKRLNLKEDEP